jgi:hypothetical protein
MAISGKLVATASKNVTMDWTLRRSALSYATRTRQIRIHPTSRQKRRRQSAVSSEA